VLPERGVSPIDSLRTELAMGYQVHIPLLRLQQCQRHSAKLTYSRLAGSQSHPLQEPGHKPIPSGHILHGRRINRTVPGRPAIPQAANAGTRSGTARAESTSVARRSQHPSRPSLPSAPNSQQPTPTASGVDPHGCSPKAEQRNPAPLAPGV
jgi:hypothetical protein